MMSLLKKNIEEERRSREALQTPPRGRGALQTSPWAMRYYSSLPGRRLPWKYTSGNRESFTSEALDGAMLYWGEHIINLSRMIMFGT